MDADPLSVIVLVDYQNIHLTAHGEFAPEGQARHLTLIHPLTFAVRTLLARKKAIGEEDYVPTRLDKVVVFRGTPSNHKQPEFYRRSQAQKSEWTKDARVEVVYRPLRYPWGWPSEPAQEKGVDVLLALRLVRAAERAEADIVILASHDTDQEPAIAMAEEFDPRIETAGWKQCKRLRGGNPSRWHTFLDRSAFEHCVDTKDYK